MSPSTHIFLHTCDISRFWRETHAFWSNLTTSRAGNNISPIKKIAVQKFLWYILINDDKLPCKKPCHCYFFKSPKHCVRCNKTNFPLFWKPSGRFSHLIRVLASTPRNSSKFTPLKTMILFHGSLFLLNKQQLMCC